MTRHEDVGVECLGRLQDAQPFARIAVARIRELLEVEHFAQVGDPILLQPILRDKHDAVAASMRPTQMQNPDLLAAQMKRDAAVVGLVGEPREPFLRRRAA